MTGALINTTNLTGNLYQYTSGVNHASGGLLIAVILLAYYLILFGVFSNFFVRIALLASSFMSIILFSLAWYANLLAGYYVAFPVVGFIAAIIILGVSDS